MVLKRVRARVAGAEEMHEVRGGGAGQVCGACRPLPASGHRQLPAACCCCGSVLRCTHALTGPAAGGAPDQCPGQQGGQRGGGSLPRLRAGGDAGGCCLACCCQAGWQAAWWPVAGALWHLLSVAGQCGSCAGAADRRMCPARHWRAALCPSAEASAIRAILASPWSVQVGRLTKGLWLVWEYEGDKTLAYYLKRR